MLLDKSYRLCIIEEDTVSSRWRTQRQIEKRKEEIMKNFMVVTLAVLLSVSGVAFAEGSIFATRDPVIQTGQVVGGAVAGGVAGDWIYRNVGHKGGTNPWPSRVIGAILGGGAVSSAQNQARCQQYGECGGSAGGQQLYRPSACGPLPTSPDGSPWVSDPFLKGCNVVTANQLRDWPFYPPRIRDGWPGGCGASGIAVCSRDYEATTGRSRQQVLQQEVPQQAQSQYAQSNRGGRQEENVLGLTVENYRNDQGVHPRCQTGNYGHDAICLNQEAQNLNDRQTACENGTGPCRQQYSTIAGAYRDLADNLKGEQRQLDTGRW